METTTTSGSLLLICQVTAQTRTVGASRWLTRRDRQGYTGAEAEIRRV